MPTARCACGAVVLDMTLPTKFVAHCSCVDCARAHGAPVVSWAGFLDEQVAVAAGAEHLRTWSSSADGRRSFCARCGTPMVFRNPARWPGETHVAASLVDALDRVADGWVYADRLPDWCHLGDGVPRYGGPDGLTPLVG